MLQKGGESMKVIVCLEENYGMSLFGKRLSFDRIVFEKIKEITQGYTLYVKEASHKILCEHGVAHEVIEDIQDVKEADFLFLEFEMIPMDTVDEIYVFHWNRKYPSSLKFKLDSDKYIVKDVEEFKGFSHEKVRLEKYVKKV